MLRFLSWFIVVLASICVALGCRSAGSTRAQADGTGGHGGHGSASASSGGMGDDGGRDGGRSDSGEDAAIVCEKGLGDCDGNPANGCETTLTGNPDHCGACNNACTGWCDRATCKNPETFATGQHYVGALDLSPTDLFWTSSASSDPDDVQFFIQKQPKSGGGNSVLAFDLPGLTDLKVDSQGVYFTSEDTVFRTALDGGSVEVFGTPGYYPRLALADFRVYWTMSYSTEGYVDWKSESANPTDPGNTLASVPGGGVAFVNSATGLDAVIYAGRDSGGSFIASVLPDGTNHETLVQPAGQVLQMSLQDGTIYYVESDPDPMSHATYVRSVPMDGGQPTTLISDGNASVALTVDGSYVYVLQEDPNQAPLGLKRVWSGDGSGVIVMVPMVTGSAMVNDDAYVYFAGGNEILRVAK
jgi:hypothetical protein